MSKCSHTDCDHGPERSPRPFLHWAGDKGYLLSEILRRLPPVNEITRYVEPFLGGGAVFCGLRAAGYQGPADLADANAGLITAWQAVRGDPEGVIIALGDLIGEHRGAESYYAVRDMWNRGRPIRASVRAARMIYLNWCSFNGLWRENARGEMNVSVGTRGKKSDIDLSAAVVAIRAIALVLAGTFFRFGDFRTTLKRSAPFGPGTAVYLDPPYTVVAPRSTGHNYVAGGWTARDRADLGAYAAGLAAEGAHVLVSEAWDPVALTAYEEIPGVVIDRVEVPRRISRDGKGRGAVPEALISLKPSRRCKN